MKNLPRILIILAILSLVIGCGVSTPAASPANTPVKEQLALEESPGGLSEDEIATLSSLEQVDDYPLYTMRYYGGYYEEAVSSVRDDEPWLEANRLQPRPAWGCSLFAALGDAGNMLYGRNFDWQYSPAVLLFTNPPDGYASVTMVDIEYLGFEPDEVGDLTSLPLVERRNLLDAPFIPFDGMNEHGLAIGMAAVPDGKMLRDPNKETIGSLGVIRRMLDYARDVDEAVDILQSYNIDFSGGPPLHYLIADSSGRSTLVEFYEGEMVVIPNETPWHLATNFLRAAAGESPERLCSRYKKISQRLPQSDGSVSRQGALDLLAKVAQSSTQWSVVYQMSSGDINVVMGQQYDKVYTFHLNQANE